MYETQSTLHCHHRSVSRERVLRPLRRFLAKERFLAPLDTTLKPDIPSPSPNPVRILLCRDKSYLSASDTIEPPGIRAARVRVHMHAVYGPLLPSFRGRVCVRDQTGVLPLLRGCYEPLLPMMHRLVNIVSGTESSSAFRR